MLLEGPKDVTRYPWRWRPVEPAHVRAVLRRVAPLEPEQLVLPPVLFAQEDYAFCSKPDTGMEQFAIDCNRLAPDPKAVSAEWALILFGRGSHTFCVLLDRERRLLVLDQVGSVYSGGGWTSFIACVGTATHEIRKLDELGAVYDLVVVREGLVSVTMPPLDAPRNGVDVVVLPRKGSR